MVARSKYYKYLQFEDKKFMWIGIVLSAVLFPIVFMGINVHEYMRLPQYYFIKGFVYASTMWYLLRYELIFLRKKYPKLSQTLKRNLYLAGYGFVLTWVICVVLGIANNYVFDYLGVEIKGTTFNVLYIIYAYFVSLSIFATYEAIYFFKKYEIAVEERERLKTTQVQTQLDNLRNQINPHFLFNSLNTLMNLIPKDPDRAMTYLNKLSKFYRYSVGKNEDNTIGLQTEIQNAKIYADLLKERFGSSIDIQFDTVANLHDQVLPMTLQLLIENAVKHNIVSKNQPLRIDISIDTDKDYLYVNNNLQKKIQAVTSTGMGLNNIKERYKYFTDHEIIVKKRDDIFEVGIPLIKSTVLV